MQKKVDYEQLAETYDRRYADGERWGTGKALLDLAQEVGASRVLEVGCGTGHWLAQLAEVVPACFGLDLSPGMLGRAARRPAALALVLGRARQLPFAPATFDLVYCVNALHHFEDQQRFVEEANRLLRPGGALAVVGSDPHGQKGQWYVYDYFDGVYERDLARYPRWAEIARWLGGAGFYAVSSRVVEEIRDEHHGRAVLADPFLQKKSCSQLALLPEPAYAAGLRRLEGALARAEAAGQTPVFRSTIDLGMVSGRKG